ncbi:Arginase/deacetylase, partial [Lichtheimia hyalospora FSU 10163]
KKPSHIFTIGGDCSIEIGPVSYLNMLYNNLGIIWFDAHGDLNIPSESPSKTFHGMPLRILLGEGDQLITENIFKKINHNQIFLMGIRDIDQKEKEYIGKYNIYSSSHVDESSIRKLITSIKSYNFNNIYIHIDLDVLDLKIFNSVKCPTPNGISYNKLIKCIELLKENFNIVGSSIVEFTNDINNNELNMLKKIFPISN